MREIVMKLNSHSVLAWSISGCLRWVNKICIGKAPRLHSRREVCLFHWHHSTGSDTWVWKKQEDEHVRWKKSPNMSVKKFRPNVWINSKMTFINFCQNCQSRLHANFTSSSNCGANVTCVKFYDQRELGKLKLPMFKHCVTFELWSWDEAAYRVQLIDWLDDISR